MGFSRQEYWSGLPFPSPGDLFHWGIEPRSPALQAGSFQPKAAWRWFQIHKDSENVLSLYSFLGSYLEMGFSKNKSPEQIRRQGFEKEFGSQMQQKEAAECSLCRGQGSSAPTLETARGRLQETTTHGERETLKVRMSSLRMRNSNSKLAICFPNFYSGQVLLILIMKNLNNKLQDRIYYLN